MIRVHAKTLILFGALALPLVMALVGGGRWCAARIDWHWTDPGVHVVDGYWVTTEHPCPRDNSYGWCAGAIQAALAADPSLRGYSAAAVADLPSHWVDGDGVAYDALGSRSWGVTLLLTLPSGERRTLWETCTIEAADRTTGPSEVVLADVETGADQTAGPPPPETCEVPGWADSSSYRVGALIPHYGIKGP